MRTTLLACSLALLAPVLRANDIHVPGDFADVPSAIAAASPDDTIVVHGGTHGPIAIDKPLRIVGAPTATFRAPDGGGFGQQPHAVTLAGPGTGTVVLARLEIGGTASGFMWSQAGDGIAGGGFEQLVVAYSTVTGHAWHSLTGIGEGSSGISTSVPLVVVSESTVRGESSGADFCYGFVSNGVPAIDAPSSEVVVLDSTVTGGGAKDLCFGTFPGPPSCPCPSSGGLGGAGIVAASVHRANSTIAGGAGSDVWDYTAGPTFLGTQSSGPAVVAAAEVDLGNELTGSGPMVQGQPWTASWSTFTFVVFLGAGVGTSAPLDLGPDGLLFFDISALVYKQTFTILASATFTVPTNPKNAGTVVTFQVWDPLTGLTRPVVGVLVP